MVAHPIALLDQQMFRNHLKIGIVLHFATHSIAVHWTMHCIALNYTALYCIVLHCTALHFAALQWKVALYWNALLYSCGKYTLAASQILRLLLHKSIRLVGGNQGRDKNLSNIGLDIGFAQGTVAHYPYKKIQVMLMYELNITF